TQDVGFAISFQAHAKATQNEVRFSPKVCENGGGAGVKLHKKQQRKCLNRKTRSHGACTHLLCHHSVKAVSGVKSFSWPNYFMPRNKKGKGERLRSRLWRRDE